MASTVLLILLCGHTTVLFGQVGVARPVLGGPSVPIGAGLSGNRSLPGGTSLRPLELVPRLGSSLPLPAGPRVETGPAAVPAVPTPRTQTRAVAPGQRERDARISQPNGQPAPRVRPGDPPREGGSPDGDDEEEREQGVRRWLRELPWWAWLLAALVVLGLIDLVTRPPAPR